MSRLPNYCLGPEWMVSQSSATSRLHFYLDGVPVGTYSGVSQGYKNTGALPTICPSRDLTADNKVWVEQQIQKWLAAKAGAARYSEEKRGISLNRVVEKVRGILPC